MFIFLNNNIHKLVNLDFFMKVSIIIPCMNINHQTVKCIRKCLELNYNDFEIIVLPDFFEKKSKNKNLKIIQTGKVKPALKRNIGMKNAKGELFAFIDDDAYPERDWLKNAVKYLVNNKIGLVGGPNLTPEEANFSEHISGYVLSNWFVSGRASIRYKIAKNQNAKELPSCNYISKNFGIEYDSNFLTAEDSKYCFDILKKGYDVLYAGDVIVRHHRRKSIWKHLKQIYVYGRDIAWLTKKEFSKDKLYYAIPSIGLFFFIFGMISILYGFYSKIVLLFFSIYFILMFLGSLNKNLLVSFLVSLVGITTHFSYGLGWIRGILSKSENNQKISWNSR